MFVIAEKNFIDMREREGGGGAILSEKWKKKEIYIIDVHKVERKREIQREREGLRIRILNGQTIFYSYITFTYNNF